MDLANLIKSPYFPLDSLVVSDDLPKRMLLALRLFALNSQAFHKLLRSKQVLLLQVQAILLASDNVLDHLLL